MWIELTFDQSELKLGNFILIIVFFFKLIFLYVFNCQCKCQNSQVDSRIE